jgi:type IV pilus assembly protein PilC
MALFNYSAKNSEGELVKGSLKATTQQAARQLIMQQGLFPVTLAQSKEKKSTGLTSGHCKLRDLSLFTWQFAAMIESGIQVVGALNALQQQTTSKVLAAVLNEVIADIQGGTSLGKSLKKFPKAFPPRYCSMVEAGELSGMLSNVLDQLSEGLDKEIDLRQKVASAMVYPIVVMVVAVICLFVLLIFVIPVFKDVYAGFGADLPLPTMVLMQLSNVTQKYSYIIIPVLLALLVGANAFRKSEMGRPIVDKYVLRIPLFGSLFQKVAVARAIRTLSEMLGAGISVIQALEQAAVTSGNALIEKSILGIIPEVTKGRNLAPLMRETGVFPIIVVHMVSAGEETGQLDHMLRKVADFYDRDIDYTIKSLMGMLEPLLTVGLGIIVAFIAVAIYMPIFNLASVMK